MASEKTPITIYQELLKRVIGNRSIRTLATESGIHFTLLSRMANGERIPKSNSDVYSDLFKCQDPDGGIDFSLEDLRNAAQAAIDYKKKQVHVAREELKEKNEIRDAYASVARGAIQSFLSDRGCLSSLTEPEEELREIVDGRLHVTEGGNDENLSGITDCYIKYVCIPDTGVKDKALIRRTVEEALSSLIFLPPSESRKVILVSGSKEVCSILTKYQNNLSFIGVLSYLNIESTKGTIEEHEVFLAPRGVDTAKMRLI